MNAMDVAWICNVRITKPRMLSRSRRQRRIFRMEVVETYVRVAELDAQISQEPNGTRIGTPRMRTTGSTTTKPINSLWMS
jgi:hypothetical protein